MFKLILLNIGSPVKANVLLMFILKRVLKTFPFFIRFKNELILPPTQLHEHAANTAPCLWQMEPTQGLVADKIIIIFGGQIYKT
jgi:hypothetical protein